MRAVISGMLLAWLASGCATPPAGGTVSRVPLRGADCLDPSAARSWQEVSSTEIHVDAGRRRYRVTLAAHCSLLGHGPEIGFEGDPISGRVCGNVGDAIVPRAGERCRIERIELIDAVDAAPSSDGCADCVRSPDRSSPR